MSTLLARNRWRMFASVSFCMSYYPCYEFTYERFIRLKAELADYSITWGCFYYFYFKNSFCLSCSSSMYSQRFKSLSYFYTRFEFINSCLCLIFSSLFYFSSAAKSRLNLSSSYIKWLDFGSGELTRALSMFLLKYPIRFLSNAESF